VNRILDVARQKRDGIIGMESPENALVDVMIEQVAVRIFR